MRGMLALTPGVGETTRPRIFTAGKPVRMHRGVQCDLTGIVSRVGVVAGDMSTDGTDTGDGA